jgi:hypothetical protein
MQGFVIVKPESNSRLEEIELELTRRSFIITGVSSYGCWDTFFMQCYSQIPYGTKTEFLKSYSEHGWGNKFISVQLDLPNQNDFLRLKSEKGHRLQYQAEKKSLRSMFGMPCQFNREIDGSIYTYSGIHTTDDEADVKQLLLALRGI